MAELITAYGCPCITEIPEEQVRADLLAVCAGLLGSKKLRPGHFYVSRAGIYTAYPEIEFDQSRVVQVMEEKEGYRVLVR